MSANTLKIAAGQIVDQFGALQNVLLTWSGADINYDEPGSVRFAAYENEAESTRKNRKYLFVMPISEIDTLTMFTKDGNVAVEISEASWQLASEKKFIPSRIFDDRDNPQMQLHSLTDLNFQIIDIPAPEFLLSRSKK